MCRPLGGLKCIRILTAYKSFIGCQKNSIFADTTVNIVYLNQGRPKAPTRQVLKAYEWSIHGSSQLLRSEDE